MNLFIPDIGTLLKLEEEWTFTLYNEYRNRTMGDIYNKYLIEISDPNGIPPIKFNFHTSGNKVIDLPKGLVVKVDRIYIRKGLSQYSSVTFTVPKPKTKKEKEEMPHNINFAGAKFWVKLHECNGIQFSTIKKNAETTELFQKLYSEIEKDASTKFGVQKCTKLLADINKLLGSGNSLNNLSTHLRYDQFLNQMIHKMNDVNIDLHEYLSFWLKSEMRDFKIKQLI
jgi:hypothetical protein